LIRIVGAVMQRQWLELVGGLVSLGVQVGFFLGQRWARMGLLASTVLTFGLTVPALPAAALGPVIGVMAVALLISWAIISDTRNKLFFKVDVPPARLKKAWDLYSNNSLARAGFMLSVLSVLMFPIAPIALVVCIVGLSRVNPTATPPIGRKKQAIAGIVLSCVGLLIGVAVFGSTVLSRLH